MALLFHSSAVCVIPILVTEIPKDVLLELIFKFPDDVLMVNMAYSHEKATLRLVKLELQSARTELAPNSDMSARLYGWLT